MATVTIHQAKTQLSKLIARAEAGEEIVIARGKEPVVRLQRVETKKRKRPPPGLFKDMSKIPDFSSLIHCRKRSCSFTKALMTILLDSHVFFWWATNDGRLSAAASEAIDGGDPVWISPVLAWEIATKVRSGKWPEAQWLAERFFEVVNSYGFQALPVTLEHAHLAGSLPGRHRDPFDRLLAAQARIEDVSLVTADPAFREFDVRILW